MIFNTNIMAAKVGVVTTMAFVVMSIFRFYYMSMYSILCEVYQSLLFFVVVMIKLVVRFNISLKGFA